LGGAGLLIAPRALFAPNGEILDGMPGLAKGELKAPFGERRDLDGVLDGIPAGGLAPTGGLNGIPLCGNILQNHIINEPK